MDAWTTRSALVNEPPNPAMGRDLRRFEDARLVRGEGRFVDDLAPKGCLHLEFFRPAFPPGRIAGLDVAAARAMPGVVAVFTGADVAGCGQAGVNPLIQQKGRQPFELLAMTHLSASGQAVAAIVATSRHAALDALEQILVEMERADRAGDETGFSARHGRSCADIFQRAAHVVEVEIAHALLAPAPLEPRACLATFGDGKLSVYSQTQTPHRMRKDLATILGLHPNAVHVTAPDVGGAFGGKASIAPEEAMVAFAAMRLQSPVRWCATRSEDFLAATRGRGASARGKLALNENGRFLAIEAEFAFPLGHWWPYSAAAPANNAARILPGPYRIAQADIRSAATTRSACAVNIYRGAGRPEAAILLERLVDKAAAATGIDPLRLRRINRAAGDGRDVTAAGVPLDSFDLSRLLKALEARADYAALRRACKRRRKRGEVVGIGIACYVEPCGTGHERGRVGIDAAGRIVAATGTSAQGQGRETAFAQIVADVLGLAPQTILLRHGDTETSPEGIGALASRSTAIGGSAILKAAEQFRNLAIAEAARLLGVAEANVAIEAAGLSSGHRHVSWAELAARCASSPHEDGLVLACDALFETAREAWASGAVLAAVAISRETGELAIEKLVWADDAGEIVNPMLVEGQLIGGMAQGFGEAVMERLAFSESGELITGSFQDYALPRAADVPTLDIIKLGTPSLANPLGVKGVGEAGCIGVPAAIANAVADALRPFGVAHVDMPFTSEKLWRLIRGAEGADLR